MSSDQERWKSIKDWVVGNQPVFTHSRAKAKFRNLNPGGPEVILDIGDLVTLAFNPASRLRSGKSDGDAHEFGHGDNISVKRTRYIILALSKWHGYSHETILTGALVSASRTWRAINNDLKEAYYELRKKCEEELPASWSIELKSLWDLPQDGGGLGGVPDWEDKPNSRTDFAAQVVRARGVRWPIAADRRAVLSPLDPASDAEDAPEASTMIGDTTLVFHDKELGIGVQGVGDDNKVVQLALDSSGKPNARIAYLAVTGAAEGSEAANLVRPHMIGSAIKMVNGVVAFCGGLTFNETVNMINEASRPVSLVLGPAAPIAAWLAAVSSARPPTAPNAPMGAEAPAGAKSLRQSWIIPALEEKVDDGWVSATGLRGSQVGRSIYEGDDSAWKEQQRYPHTAVARRIEKLAKQTACRPSEAADEHRRAGMLAPTHQVVNDAAAKADRRSEEARVVAEEEAARVAAEEAARVAEEEAARVAEMMEAMNPAREENMVDYMTSSDMEQMRHRADLRRQMNESNLGQEIARASASEAAAVAGGGRRRKRKTKRKRYSTKRHSTKRRSTKRRSTKRRSKKRKKRKSRRSRRYII
jgi:hypothetical protein